MKYDNPFPGMNPYLERSDLWPDFHNDLIAQLRTALGPQLPADYRIGLQQRVEIAEPFGPPPSLSLMIPDALVSDAPSSVSPGGTTTAAATTAVAAPPKKDAAAIPVRMPREVRVTWLRVEAAPNRQVVTIIEVLSPTNKAPGEGRRRYIRKRAAILAAGVNLVEIDLLRRWEPMPLETPPPASDYRILVCRAWQRPDALLYPFTVRQPIPPFPLPLLPSDDGSDDAEPEVNLGPIIAGMHHTARYTQVAAYENPPPEPAFPPETQQWIAERLAAHQYAPQCASEIRQ